MLAGGGEHAVGLGRVAAQPGFGQDMLASVQGSQGNGTMQIRPGADDHGVKIAIGNQVLPTIVRTRYAVFLSHCPSGFGSAITDGQDLDIRQGPQTGDVTKPGIGTRADQANTQSGGRHETPQPGGRGRNTRLL